MTDLHQIGHNDPECIAYPNCMAVKTFSFKKSRQLTAAILKIKKNLRHLVIQYDSKAHQLSAILDFYRQHYTKRIQEFFATRGDTLYAVIFGVEEWTKGQLIHAKYTHRCWGGVWAQESEFFLPNLYQVSKYKHITLAHPLHILEIFSDWTASCWIV